MAPQPDLVDGNIAAPQSALDLSPLLVASNYRGGDVRDCIHGDESGCHAQPVALKALAIIPSCNDSAAPGPR
jgi:hypothetical protein